MTAEKRGRGRPKIRHDDDILDSALRVFATYGYEGMSIRALNNELGLSHATINQRFGSKEQLYLDAIDHGFTGLLVDMRALVAEAPLPADPLEELRIRFRSFLIASSRRPHLSRLINNEGVNPSPMLDHIHQQYITPAMKATRRLVTQLAADGIVEPLGDRDILFLLANGAASAYSLPALAAKFDRSDGAVEPGRYADRMATILVNAMRR